MRWLQRKLQRVRTHVSETSTSPWGSDKRKQSRGDMGCHSDGIMGRGAIRWAGRRHGFEAHSAGKNGPHCSARADPSLASCHGIRALGKDLRTDVSQLTHRTCDLEEIEHGQFPLARKLAPLDHVLEKVLAAEICVTVR